jgi:ectoine hydroxylase-related dioxygenase (phytanoyl-CoA dioxygenase family)
MNEPDLPPVDPAVVEQLEQNGYAVLPGVLEADRVARLKAELEAAIGADNAVFDRVEALTGSPHPDRWMVHNAMLRGAELARMLDHPLMQAYFARTLGARCILYSYQTSSLPPNGTNYSNRIHVDCPRLIPGYPTNLGALFPLDDLTADNGATYVLPGSHTLAEAPDLDEFERKAVRLFCDAGSMLLLNSRLWHRGGVNTTARARHMLTIGGCRSYMRSRFDFPQLIENTGSKILDIVGPVGRRFLGYNVRMPASMDEYYRPPEQRLYLAGQG